MRNTTVFALTAAMCLGGAAHAACPVTTADDPLFGRAIPGWYGTEALAVTLSDPARWSTTPPGFAIGEKLFWRSAGYRPGLESHLKITIRSLDGQPVTGRISEATNAYIPERAPERPLTDREQENLVYEPGGWVMLTGVDFRDAGCWEIKASYLGQTLSFVVETVKH